MGKFIKPNYRCGLWVGIMVVDLQLEGVILGMTRSERKEDVAGLKVGNGRERNRRRRELGDCV